MKGHFPIDNWTLVHILSGAGLAILGTRPMTAASLLLAFELFECQIRAKSTPTGTGLFEHESDGNVAMDLLTGMAGYFAARRFM